MIHSLLHLDIKGHDQDYTVIDLLKMYLSSSGRNFNDSKFSKYQYQEDISSYYIASTLADSDPGS
jgi:hypothetical protein